MAGQLPYVEGSKSPTSPYGGWLPSLPQLLLGPITGSLIDSGTGGGGGDKKDPKKKKGETAAEKAAAASKAETKALETEFKDIETSPWTTAANALSKSFQSDLAAVQPDISGAAGPGAMTSAASQAAGDLGLPSMSPGAAWLAQGASNAQAQTQGVSQAMNAEGQAYAAAAGPISAAITQWGQDNAIGDITAPEASWLSALASHVTSNLSYQGYVPKGIGGTLPYSVVKTMQNVGGYPGSTGSGLVPLQDVGKGPGGTSVVKAPPAANTGPTATAPSLTGTSTNAGGP